MPNPALSTGIPALDKVLGRSCPGVPIGRMTEVYGLQGCGSTALAISLAETVLEDGGNVTYFDFAGDVLERLKVEDGLTVFVNGEELLAVRIREAVRTAVKLVVVDSVDRVYQNRNNFPVRQISQEIQGSATALVVVRRYPLHPDPSPWLELAFNSYVRVRLSGHRDEEDENLFKVRADITKTLVSATRGKSCEFWLRDGRVERTRHKKRGGSGSGPSRFDRDDVV
jgi:hypothetical protein